MGSFAFSHSGSASFPSCQLAESFSDAIYISVPMNVTPGRQAVTYVMITLGLPLWTLRPVVLNRP